jgi:hypothetical protein
MGDLRSKAGIGGTAITLPQMTVIERRSHPKAETGEIAIALYLNLPIPKL